MSFDNSFVSYPVCCPSRATFFSGQYAHNHSVLGLYPPTGGYGKFDMDNSLGTWLQRAGYHTGHIGKLLNGYGSDSPADVPRGYDEWYASVDPSTYRMHGYTLNENGTFRTYGDPTWRTRPPTRPTSSRQGGGLHPAQRRPQPFFLSLAFVAPHHEQFRSPDGNGRVRAAGTPAQGGLQPPRSCPIPPNFGEADLTDKPATCSAARRR